MAKEAVILVDGVIVEAFPGDQFQVSCTVGKEGKQHFVRAHLSGKIRKNSIKVIAGDKVTVELTPYDMTKGRIVFRER